jgi:branched-chain amino acid transport system ATP-binding protein
MSAELLEVAGLGVSYGSVKALDGVDLRIPAQGEIRGVIGPNGAGKSTLIDVMSGRRRPSCGRIVWRGHDISRRSVTWRRRNGMARSFQRTSIFPSLTVIEQLRLVASHLGAVNVDAVVAAMDLGRVCDRRADSIAYGDQRRVDVGLALLGRPSIVLLDEPAAGLSQAETQSLFEHVSELVRRQGITALIVEHDVDAVFRFCDIITVLDLGRVLMTGSPDEVRADPRVIAAYLGSQA